MNTSSANIRNINLSPDEFTLDELKSRLHPILERATAICDAKMSLINILNETGPETLAAHGEEDQQLISCVNKITDAAASDREMLVISNPADYPQVASQLSDNERNRIRFYARTPLKSDVGKPVGYLCVCDVTSRDLSDDQQKQLQLLGDGARTLLQLYNQSKRLSKKNEKLNIYSLLLKNSADITFTLEQDSGRIMDVNSGIEKELGYQPDDLKGRLFADIIQSNPFEGHSIEEWMSSIEKHKGRYTKLLKLIDHQQHASWFQCNFTTEDGRWFVTARDISEKKEAKKGILDLQEKIKKVVHVSTDLIYELDWNSGDLSWGDELSDVLGYPNTDRFVDYDWWIDKIHPEDLNRVIHDVAESVDGESDRMKLVYRIRTYEGPYKYVMNNNYVDRDEDGNPENIIGAIVDISDLVKSEERSERHKQLLKKVSDNAWSATWIRDENGTFMFANKAFKTLYQLEDQSLTDSTADNLFDEDTASEMKARDKEVLESGDRVEYEKEFEVEGENKFFKFSLFPIFDAPGEDNLVGGVAFDITDEKESRLLLEQSLEEKETLLMEIHHRVKNNLAVVSGMMQLQAFKETNKNVQEKLFASTSRIKTMAAIHELLYQSASFTDLKFDENIEKLVTEITGTYQVSIDLDITYDLDPVELNINQAIPCSLVVNEVVTNVLKHAYDDGDTGMMEIFLKEEDENIDLRIRDDGKGLPDNFDVHQFSESLGLELIDTLASQLKGEYNYRSLEQGTEFRLTFEKLKVKDSGSYINKGSAG